MISPKPPSTTYQTDYFLMSAFLKIERETWFYEKSTVQT